MGGALLPEKTASRKMAASPDRRSKRPIDAPADADHRRDAKRSRGDVDGNADGKVSDAPKRKSLDELFRKTKAQPCIYWLPKVE
jgi:hypothetical protein